MYHEYLATPKMMNMGFHYTEQYSRRNRIKVLNLVDHSTQEWSEWYHKTHEFEALQKMADAGYNLIEIHFLYGYGLKGEADEIELTKKMVENAHAAGIKVLGYFQFQSVQEELFFIENPWAEDCLQVDANGARREYCYDRPILCFSHDKVKQYYFDGIELGIKYCGLDGIRLDNDYYRGCYCPECRKLFRKYLVDKFSPQKAREVFGFSDLSNISMPPSQRKFDPAWLEMMKFRQQHRQNMMSLIHDKIVSIKPDAILGGNPAVTRRFDNDCFDGFYPPDLGTTHHLICGENSFFPEVIGNSIRTQAVIYKFGESSGFKIFPSHHIYENDAVRWPENSAECARTLCEALCFGGHIPCTTWGIRMDGGKDKTLYERPEFLKATRSISRFIKENPGLYWNVSCTAPVGIYINRENRISNSTSAFASLHGIVQILFKMHIPFRFIAHDQAELLNGLELLIVPDVLPVSDRQLKNFIDFSATGKILFTGGACSYDENFLARTVSLSEIFKGNDNVKIIAEAPEAINPDKVESIHGIIRNIPMPEGYEELRSEILKLYEPAISISGGRAVVADVYQNSDGWNFLHILNYNNDSPSEITVKLPDGSTQVKIFSPEHFGVAGQAINDCSVSLSGLDTYAVIKYR
jgi:hypothetical protein